MSHPIFKGVATAIAAARMGKLKVDVVSYPDILTMGEGRFMQGPYYSRSYRQHFRIGGVKLTLDGSPQGKTAWLTQPYVQPPAGQPRSYAGYVTPQDVKSIAPDVLRHRVIPSFEAEAEELTSDKIVAILLNELPVP